MTRTTNHSIQHNLQFIALALLLSAWAMTALASAKSKQEELPEGSEAAKAVARLGDLSRPALRERLKQMQQPAYLPGQLLVPKTRRSTEAARRPQQAR